MNNVSQASVDALLADFMQDKKKMLDLLHQNGINVGNALSLKVVQTAFLKAIKDSDNFRGQVTAVLAQHAQSQNFVDNSKYLNYDDPEPWLGGTPGAATTTSVAPAPKKSFFGSIFTPDLIQTGIKTGLDTLSTSAKTKAQSTSEQNALELERIRLQQIQAQGQANQAKPGTMSTGAKVAIGIGGAAVVGTIIWLVIRARKKKG